MSGHISIQRADVRDSKTCPPRIKLYLRILAGAIMLGDTEVLLVFLCEFEPKTRLSVASTTYVLYLLLTLTLRITKIMTMNSDPRVLDIDYFSFPFILSLVPLGILSYLVNEHFIGAASLLSLGLLSLVVLVMHTLFFTWVVRLGLRLFVHNGWHTFSWSMSYSSAMDRLMEGLPFWSWRLGMPGVTVLNDRAASFV